MTEQVAKLMKNLNITEEEAEAVIADDKRIEKGEKLFELPKELQAGAKKARQADRKPTVYNFDTSKRERKQDDTKREIMAVLCEMFKADNLEVTNPERELTFTKNERKFKIVLSCPRS